MELRRPPSNSLENYTGNRCIIDACTEESTSSRQIHTIESVGDSITFIDGTSPWNKDYKCLRKAFLIFIISFKLNLIQEAAGIVHQFLHLYPTFVGWLYLVTKLKRLMFSFLELIGQHPSHDSRKGYAQSFPTMSEKDQTPSNYDFKSVLSDDTLLKLRNLEMNETRVRERIRTLIKAEPKKLGHELETDDDTDSNKIIHETSSVSSSNKNKFDSTKSNSGINVGKRENSYVPIKVPLIPQFEEKRDDIADSSWGHFVDCLSEDSSDKIQREDISRIQQVFSEDYGHFVDIQEE